MITNLLDKCKKVWPFALLVIMAIEVVTWVYPEITIDQTEELKAQLLVKEVEIEKLKANNDTLAIKLKSFEYEIHKSDSIIDNSTIHELDSLFTDYFRQSLLQQE